MSKKLKSLICSIIAGMMLTTSCGLSALAADDTTSAVTESTVTETTDTADAPDDEKDAAEATDAPAATEAAEETTETTETDGASYADDTYYNNALQVCSALGIITGYDDGSIKPESTVTRAEMAAIVLRMLNLTSVSTYQNVFSDVTSEHWAADTIQTAVEQGIVDGMGDGTFVPDGQVKYEQVIKMIVCAMGYQIDADRAGGYPTGYLTVGGTTLELLKSVSGATGEDMPRGEVIKAVYNAMQAPYRTITDFSNGNPVYSADDTLGVEKFNMYEETGTLTATPTTSTTASVATKEDIVVIDGVQYKCTLANIDGFLGTSVKFYYIDSKSDDPEIIAMFSAGKTTDITVDAENIYSMTLGTDTASGELRAYTSSTSTTTKKYTIKALADVIYNGSSLTKAQFLASSYSDSMTYDEFVTPEVGTIRLVDYESDGIYDAVFVDSYQTMLVTSATAEKVSGKIDTVATTINVEDEANEKTITVTRAGVEATPKNLKKNDVASIKRNVDDTIIDITVTGETVTGTITGIGSDDDGMVITVNGDEYKVDKNAEEYVKSGLTAVLYLDKFNRVGYIESSTGTMLSGNEKYGYVANVYFEDNGDLTVKIFSQDGETVVAKPSSKMKFWGPTDTAERTISDEDLEALFKVDDNFLQCGTSPVKLCKYSVNSSNELTKLYMAVDQAIVSDTSALRVYNKSLSGVGSVGGTVNGYYIQDGIVEFTVPSDKASRTNPANYKIGSVTSSTYVYYDGGANVDYTIGDFMNSRSPQVLVKFESGSNVAAKADTVGNANNPPTFMVSKILEAVDSDGNEVFELQGYSAGTSVSYTTGSNTGVYDFGLYSTGKEYDGTLVFDATSNDASEFTKYVSPGDVFVVGTSGSTLTTMIKLADVDRVAKTAITGATYEQGNQSSGQWQDFISSSTTRDQYYAGFITNVDINDYSYISVYDTVGLEDVGTVTYDTSAAFSYATATVDSSGNVLSVKVDESGGLDAAEIMCYGANGTDPNVFDYGIFKLFKGSMYAGYIIRVEIVD